MNNSPLSTMRLLSMNSKISKSVRKFFTCHASRITHNAWFVLATLALLCGSQRASAFAIIGPLENWMSPDNGFNPIDFDRLQAGPKELGFEFRRNTPVMYWGCDENFIDYFGSNGVRAVEQAYSQFNSVGKLSNYSLDLSEWPLESQRHNFAAAALNLFDLKSVTMGLMMEQLGLQYPQRYMWVIHNRAHLPNTPPCPDGMDYLVVKRNYDPVPSGPDQYATSSYVNGILYTYAIIETCVPPPPLADAVEFPVDFEADNYTSVSEWHPGLEGGGFYLSLTREDVGGMRYLLRTNNINLENLPFGSVEFVTNDTAQLIFGSNLTLFAAQALTNSAAALQALYPGLVITSTTNIFTNVFTTNVFATLVPGPPWAPAGVFQLAFTTNVTQSVQTLFIHTFGNLLQLKLVNGQWVTVPLISLSQANGVQIVNFQTSNLVITNPPFAPANNFQVVNTTRDNFRLQTGPVGEFFILNGVSNLCDVQILANQITNIVPITNIIASGTNIALGFTNVLGGSNFFNGQILSSTLSLITYFTNHAFVIFPVTCPGTNTTLFQGIDGVSFIRADFDSLLGRFFQPITNDFVLNEITNGVIFPRHIRRTITQPDFLFTAADLNPGPNTFPYAIPVVNRGPTNYNTTIPGTAGPGTIERPVSFIFNSSLPIYENQTVLPFSFLDELSQILVFGIGSFDATTNPPVVYPNGAALGSLQNAILLPISPNTLSTGNVGVDYSVQFSSLGGQPPLTFSLAPGSNPLPPGISLDSDGNLSGTPTTAGTFEFTIRLQDSSGRTNDRLYTLVIFP